MRKLLMLGLVITGIVGVVSIARGTDNLNINIKNVEAETAAGIFAGAAQPSEETLEAQSSSDTVEQQRESIQQESPDKKQSQKPTFVKTTYKNHLAIPSIGVNAQVISMGIDPDGRMAVPNNFTQIGLYGAGVYPGEPGTAVMGAHVDNGGSTAGVFKYLNKLAVGDTVQYINAEGEMLTFKVIKTKVFDKNANDVGEVFFSDGSVSRLNLITFTGTWLSHENTYSSRLVVFTELVQ